MNALLGRITRVRKRQGGKATRGQHRLVVSFKPVCVMPSRAAVPPWLRDQDLTVSRTVADPRELGGVGDSLVLTPGESARWLFPLRVEPEEAYAKVPEKVRLTLRWWKDRRPGDCTVCANGRRRTAKFARRGEVFTASFVPRDFFDGEPSLPASFEVSFGELKVGCAVLPAERSCYCRLRTARGDRHRIESRWYTVDVCADRWGGGISMLREKGRRADHFTSDDDLVHDVFDHGGHIDRVEIGWKNKMRDVAMTCASARREGEATRLRLEGALDDAKGIRTSAAYTVFDNLPLVALQRDVLVHRGSEQKEDKKKDKQKPKEPIDELIRVSLGFRAAFPAESEGHSGSRVLSVDEDRFAVVRTAQPLDWFWPRWRLKDGWVLVEHPRRRQCMLYLFATQEAPTLRTWTARRVVALEPRWAPTPVRPQSGTGFALALSAGELCGADVAGAWVACRRPAGEGVQCALVGHFRRRPGDARFVVGGAAAEAAIERLLLPGIGTVYVASAHMAKGRMADAFDASAGNIPARRAT
jgi:hypothetical protein